ncbi:MAG: hypothetical protein IJV58_00335 [Oscillospiraceae bacterium]|nr:hypothetical protein [Oscillospiraceae bacterium]
MTDNTTVHIYEQPGKLGALKASQLARLIEAYAIAHPEVTGPMDAKKEVPPCCQVNPRT